MENVPSWIGIIISVILASVICFAAVETIWWMQERKQNAGHKIKED